MDIRRPATIFVVLVLACLALPVSHANAHVLIRDESRRIGAVLHINPDDDPVAGQNTTLLFDVEGQHFGTANTASLLVSDADDKRSRVPLTVSGTTAEATYAFPVQGTYRIELRVGRDNQTYRFDIALRISRGPVGSTVTAAPGQEWAYTGLLVSGTGLMLAGIFAYNKRKDILAYSTFK